MINQYYIDFLLKKDTITDINQIDEVVKSDTNLLNLYNSHIEFNKKDYPKSKDFAIKILDDKNNCPNLILAESYNILGRIARLYKLEDDAKGFYDSAMDNFKQDSSFFGTFGVIRLDFNLANILLLSSKLSEALSSYNDLLGKIDSLEVNEDLKQELLKLKLKIFQNKALTLLYLGKSDESKECFEDAIKLVSTVEGTSTEADLYLNYTNLTLIKEDLELTYSLLTKAGSLYSKLGKIDIASKIEIDKIKINMVNNTEQLIDPVFVSNLISLYEKARGKDAGLRVIEICELLYAQGRFDETRELIDYLLQKDFLPDLRGRILFITMNLRSFEGKYKEVILIGKELIEITKLLKDEESVLPINILLSKAKFMIDNNKEEMFKSLKNHVNLLIKEKDFESAITIYEEYFPILFERKEYSFIIEILQQVEEMVLKKIKDDQVKEFHDNDLILLFALNKNDKSKKLYSKVGRTFDQIVENSRYKTLLGQNKDLENVIKEYLAIA